MNDSFTFWEAIESGVYIIIPLAFLLIVSLWIWCKRTSVVIKEQKQPAILMQKIRDYVIEGDLENATGLCRSSDSSAALILRRGVSRIGYPISEVADSMSEITAVEDVKLERGLGWLKAIAVIAPLLGAIGTLTGITVAFHNVTTGPDGFDNAILCELLSPTFITVAAGLGVGIISLVALTSLEGVVKKTQNRLSSLCVEFLDLLNEPS